ncbi:hypothetical protein PBY51_022039 [Eleginops maclovinus]|uniref:Uncharacterized protein n=1 Tax=Eleginops maclovinus TaxID=56733 RepID=A0AAN7XJ32_ELEMC|nr:hypothetical protein PBY51_022039 [Eleginops maclovinus]
MEVLLRTSLQGPSHSCRSYRIPHTAGGSAQNQPAGFISKAPHSSLSAPKEEGPAGSCFCLDNSAPPAPPPPHFLFRQPTPPCRELQGGPIREEKKKQTLYLGQSLQADILTS